MHKQPPNKLHFLQLPFSSQPLRACLYDPGHAGRDAYRDPVHNTNSNECLYDAATYHA
jgi:hypothetical protein